MNRKLASVTNLDELRLAAIELRDRISTLQANTMGAALLEGEEPLLIAKMRRDAIAFETAITQRYLLGRS